MKTVITFLLMLVAATAQADNVPQLDVDAQLRYCDRQLHRALTLLQRADGSYDFSQEPRNIVYASLKNKEERIKNKGKQRVQARNRRSNHNSQFSILNSQFSNLNPQTTLGWNCRPATAEEWCGGFFPGMLWMDYQLFGDTAVLRAAEGYTDALRHIAYEPIFDHDIGFLMFCSFGKGYDAALKIKEERRKNKEAVQGSADVEQGSAAVVQTDSLESNHNSQFSNLNPQSYKQVILASADSLATLFNPMVGTILSWPRNVRMFGGHNTIMDNMMNLDMLFWASRHDGNPLLYDIAVAHAATTMRHHFRADGSCYHVAVYDSTDGHFLRGVTHQGYADSSVWARGQSWAVYGYTMVYRYTHNPVFLRFAEKVTDAYLSRLMPDTAADLQSVDLIPRWDFDDPAADAPKDASAACVVADALIELSQYVGGSKGQRYHDLAVAMLAQLSTPQYLCGDRSVSFLMHSTGHHPAGSEIDASIVYADYYYLEALTRLKAAQ